MTALDENSTGRGSAQAVAAPIVHPRPEHTPGVSLESLLLEVGAQRMGDESLDATIHGVTISTDDVRAGDLWVGLPGVHTHGAEFAQLACELGAVAVLTDSEGAARVSADGELGVPLLVLDELRERLGEVCALVYGTESKRPQLFGVTGTNGKTSTVHMLHSVLELLGKQAAVSSTVERRMNGERVVSGLTTPEATDMHALIATMKESGVDAAAFEVSAQALTRHRIGGISFDVVGFTNLSHDHLDDYGDMETYFSEKSRFFTPAHASRGVISLETEWGKRLAASSGIPVVTISANASEAANWHVEVHDTDEHGTAFTLSDEHGRSLEARSAVPGAHMARNLALAIVMLLEAGFEFDAIAHVLGERGTLPQIPGRLENIAGAGAPSLYVDFGHSEDAFRSTLAAVRPLAAGRVFMVFGADGDRDATKRDKMAEAAVNGSDVLIITDHHPRFEDPASIRSTLARAAMAARPEAELHVVSPPPAAIQLAVKLAEPGDVIVWAGPGHQNYRDIRGVRTAYSAREEGREALRSNGYEVRQ